MKTFIIKKEITLKINDFRLIFTKKELDLKPKLKEWCNSNVNKYIHYEDTKGNRLSSGEGSKLSSFNNNSFRLSIEPFLKSLNTIDKIVTIWIVFYDNKIVISDEEILDNNGIEEIKSEYSYYENIREDVTNNTDVSEYTHFQYGKHMTNELVNHEPVNEIGVIYLFSLYAIKYGILITSFSERKYPDAEALFPKPNNKFKKRYIEFEYKSSSFKKHESDESHILKNVDIEEILVVCWIHDYKNCPTEVLCLRDYFMNRD